MEQLATTKDAKTKLKINNQSIIMQLGIHRVALVNNNKCKTCNFLVVPGNGQTLLSVPDIKLQNILTISYNTISIAREDKDTNCSTNRHHTHDAGNEQCCANTGPEKSCTRTNSNAYSYTNKGKNSNLNNNNNTFTPLAKIMMSNIFFQALPKKVIEKKLLK